VLDAILMEEQGVPAIAIVTTPFRNTGRAMAESWGRAPFLDMPHPIANRRRAADERCDRLVGGGGMVGFEALVRDERVSRIRTTGCPPSASIRHRRSTDCRPRASRGHEPRRPPGSTGGGPPRRPSAARWI
jgi:hypothetical protein